VSKLHPDGRVHQPLSGPRRPPGGSACRRFSINPRPQVDPVLAELERIALRDAPSGRAALAKVTALRTLEKLARPANDDSYPVDDDGRFHPGPPESWDLYRCDSDETREGWRASWERSPQGRRWRAGP
jgi:hypothetical protein